MKRYLSAILMTALLLTASACHTHPENHENQTEPAKDDTPITQPDISESAAQTEVLPADARIPSEGCVHTQAFHTITDALINHVGENAYNSFRDRYAGTEEFNILNFLSYFYISPIDAMPAMQKNSDTSAPYTHDILYADAAAQRAFFMTAEFQNTDAPLYYGYLTLAECGQVTEDYILQFAICAFLRGDLENFTKYCGVKPEVYAHMETMKIGNYTLSSVTLPDADNPEYVQSYPCLTFTVTESQSDIFPVGEHTLIWESGLYLTFSPKEAFEESRASHTPMSSAEQYIFSVNHDRDFSTILEEGKRQAGLCDFILARLNVIHGNHEPRTAQEIGDYAEKYLGVDRTALQFENKVDKTQDGRYVRIGRGTSSYYYSLLSEEIRNGITVVTVQYYADPSKTVPSRKVEYHMEQIDGEYKPLHTVILEDSPFQTAHVST